MADREVRDAPTELDFPRMLGAQAPCTPAASEPTSTACSSELTVGNEQRWSILSTKTYALDAVDVAGFLVGLRVGHESIQMGGVCLC